MKRVCDRDFNKKKLLQTANAGASSQSFGAGGLGGGFGGSASNAFAGSQSFGGGGLGGGFGGSAANAGASSQSFNAGFGR